MLQFAANLLSSDPFLPQISISSNELSERTIENIKGLNDPCWPCITNGISSLTQSLNHPFHVNIFFQLSKDIISCIEPVVP